MTTLLNKQQTDKIRGQGKNGHRYKKSAYEGIEES
jgi:hypothetical protein